MNLNLEIINKIFFNNDHYLIKISNRLLELDKESEEYLKLLEEYEKLLIEKNYI